MSKTARARKGRLSILAAVLLAAVLTLLAAEMALLDRLWRRQQ